MKRILITAVLAMAISSLALAQASDKRAALSGNAEQEVVKVSKEIIDALGRTDVVATQLTEIPKQQSQWREHAEGYLSNQVPEDDGAGWAPSASLGAYGAWLLTAGNGNFLAGTNFCQIVPAIPSHLADLRRPCRRPADFPTRKTLFGVVTGVYKNAA